MKKIAVLAAAFSLLLAACKEKPIEIPELKAGNRKVLVEELTGANCPNCPAGTDELSQLLGVYGHNLVVVSIHAGARGSFNIQLPGAKHNFNTNELESLVPVIGEPFLYPSAAINRQLANNDPALFYEQPWGGLVTQEFGQDFGLDMSIENQYDAASRRVDANISIISEGNLTGAHRLTVYLVEDNIVDPQNYFGHIRSDYVHRHILRKVLTDVSGDAIAETLSPGAKVSRQISYTLPAEFNAENCSIVAFVHHGGSPDKEVLEVEEAHVIE